MLLKVGRSVCHIMFQELQHFWHVIIAFHLLLMVVICSLRVILTIKPDRDCQRGSRAAQSNYVIHQCLAHLGYLLLRDLKDRRPMTATSVISKNVVNLMSENASALEISPGIAKYQCNNCCRNHCRKTVKNYEPVSRTAPESRIRNLSKILKSILRPSSYQGKHS